MRPESLSLAAATGRFGGEPRCPVRPKSGTPRLSVGTAGVKGGPGTPPIAQAAAQLQVHMSTGGGSDRDRNPTAGKRRPFWQWPSSGLGSCLACAFSCSLQTLPFSRGRRELERTPEPAPPALNRRSCIQAREAPGRRESRPIIRGPARHTPEPVPPTLNRRSCIQACEALHFPLAVTMFPSRCVYTGDPPPGAPVSGQSNDRLWACARWTRPPGMMMQWYRRAGSPSHGRRDSAPRLLFRRAVIRS